MAVPFCAHSFCTIAITFTGKMGHAKLNSYWNALLPSKGPLECTKFKNSYSNALNQDDWLVTHWVLETVHK